MQQLFALLVVLVFKEIKADPGDFRPPAVPLIVFSPHVSGKRDFNFTRKKGGAEWKILLKIVL
jgi:hypothetical protein